MQNSFEKQVQQKMDELKFDPTAPVWKNIEEQIRVKRDRLRLIVWLPLFVLLTGAGTWWILAGTHTSNPGAGQMDATKEGSTLHQEPQQDKEAIKENGTTALETTPSQPASPQKDVLSLTFQSSHFQTKKHRPAISLAPVNWTETRKETITSNPSPAEINENEERLADQKVAPVIINRTSALEKNSEAVMAAPQIKAALATPLSIVPASAEVQTQPAPGYSKWQFGITAAAGMSGISKGLNVFSSDKSLSADMAYAPSSTPTPASNASTSPIDNNVAFAVGIIAKRKLNDRIALATGLQYHFYSNDMSVGQLRRQDTVVVGASRRVREFYLNSGSDFKSNQNQFHFIAIPLSFEWQVWKKAPLYLQTGLSLQQLISDKALVFDQGSAVYYSDNSAYNKTQVFSNFGLSYAVINGRKTSLLLGPQLQYGLTRTEKYNSNYHLFALGLSMQLLFQKK